VGHRTVSCDWCCVQPPRSAHPVVKFSCTPCEPVVIENLPFDKYELEPSPLTQYILERRQPNVAWQVGSCTATFLLCYTLCVYAVSLEVNKLITFLSFHFIASFSRWMSSVRFPGGYFGICGTPFYSLFHYRVNGMKTLSILVVIWMSVMDWFDSVTVSCNFM